MDAPPYDAVLVDSNSGYIGAMQGHETAKAILTIGSAAQSTLPNTLARPLRSEMLEAWLLQTQRQFFPEFEPSAPASKPQPPGVAASSVINSKDTGSYKLLRWPPAAMLRNDARLIRMATILSRRPVSASELAQVSQQSLDSARAFLATLRTAALLDNPWQAQPSLQPVPENIIPRTVHSTQKVERSLMSRIRLRLGL